MSPCTDHLLRAHDADSAMLALMRSSFLPFSFLFSCAVACAACGKKVPSEVQASIDKHHAAALKVATDASSACPAMKASAPFNPNPMAAPPPPPNPAKGTALESDPNVVDVLVMCSWTDPRGKGETMAGSGMPSLKNAAKVPTKQVTMPDDMATNTCAKNENDCEQVIVPSRYGTSAKSADLRIVKKATDGGRVEVTVVFAVP